MRSGFDSAGDGGYYLYSDGILYGGVTNRIFAVRPASSNAVNFKKAADTRAFGSVARIYNAWVRSGSYSNANYAYRLIPDGTGLYNGTAYLRYAVRPASLDCDKFEKPRISRTFGSVARIYNAWLRSGYVSNARGAYRLDPVGGGSYDYTDYRYSVRPALHLFAEKFIADNSRIRLV